MSKDIELLVKNAKTYNEPGSQVFKVTDLTLHSVVVLSIRIFNKINLQDANTIKRIFSQKKTELEHMEPIKSSIRIRFARPNTRAL